MPLPRPNRSARSCTSLVLALVIYAASAFGAGERDDQIKPDLRSTLAGSSGSKKASGAPSNQTDELFFGSPPGSGAGETGFVSTNKPIRRANKLKKVAAQKKAPAIASVPATASAGQARVAVPPATTGLVPRQPRRPAKPEEDHYAPLGVRVGSFLVKPSVEISEGYDDNPFRVANGRGSPFTIVTARVNARSEWSRHEMNVDLRGSYTGYSSVDRNNRPEAEAMVRGRIDVTSTSRIEIESKAQLSTERAGSPDSVSAVERPPNIYTLSSTTGYIQRFNRLEMALRGTVERRIHEDGELISGGTVDLSDRDYTSYGAKLRGSYEVTPGVKPFAEAGLDRRVFDRDIDFTGVRRGSDGMAVRTGIAFEHRGFFTGEASIGFARRSYVDSDLADITGLIFDSSLVWKATALTTVTFAANSTIGETRLAGASGVFTREAKITVDHAFRRWLIASASVAYGHEDYRGVDRLEQRLGLSAALTYHLNRSLALKGEVRHERLNSNVPGADYTANIVLVGLRLQR